jgi:IS5 family transposase
VARVSFEKYGRTSCLEEFLDVMETIIPWRELKAVIAPHYPKVGNGH